MRDPDAGTPKGLVIGKREPTMGLRGIPEAEVIFEDLEIPDEMVLRTARRRRRSASRALMNAYNSQRVGAATVALGLAQGAFDTALPGSSSASSSAGRSPSSRACNGCWPTWRCS